MMKEKEMTLIEAQEIAKTNEDYVFEGFNEETGETLGQEMSDLVLAIVPTANVLTEAGAKVETITTRAHYLKESKDKPFEIFGANRATIKGEGFSLSLSFVMDDGEFFLCASLENGETFPNHRQETAGFVWEVGPRFEGYATRSGGDFLSLEQWAEEALARVLAK